MFTISSSIKSILLLVIILFLTTSNQILAQGFEPLSKEDSALLYPTDKPSFVERMLAKGFAVFPVAFFLPETGFGGGVAGFYYFRLAEDSITRPSSLNLVAVYTQNEQLILQLPFQLSFLENKSLLEGQITYSRYPFQFYGVGNNIDFDEFEDYEPNIARVRGVFYKKLKKNVFLGPRLLYEHQNITSIEQGKKLDTQNFVGKNGGAVFGLGASLLVDRRNNIFTSTKGSYFNITSYISNDGFLADFSMTETLLDFRKYFKTGKSSFATQLFVQHQTGDVPFFSLTQMGGSSQMRGFFQGAYRDKSYATVQVEYRFPLIGRLGAVAFGSAGQVNTKFELEPDYFRYAGGAGLRFLFNKKEKINLRIDYALGKNTSGLYFTIGEAF